MMTRRCCASWTTSSSSSPSRRVVVTGLGAITPLGATLADTWDALLDHRSGVTTLREALECQWPAWTRADWRLAEQLPSQVAAPVRELVREARTARFVQLALRAGRDALEHAELIKHRRKNDTDQETNDDDCILANAQRSGVSIGCAMSSAREFVDAVRLLDAEDQKGLRKLSPHFVPKVLSNSATGRLSMAYNLRGPQHSAATACAAGSHAIADAYNSIVGNHADIMLAGGTEACLDPFSMAGFARARALATDWSPPTAASRPFDARRNGFVMGEGAAVLVLEELQHALRRNAPILAELYGYGLSGDAHHVTAPPPDGHGAEQAMRNALQQANLSSDQVGYVNAHATSTPKGDEIEARAIHRVFNTTTRQQPLLVSSTKGATAHLLGAAGAIEAAFTVRTLLDQCVPPTLNLEHADDETLCFEHVPRVKRLRENDEPLEVAMSNSFGFGGANVSLVFRRWNDESNEHS